jgi:hypothetical protein
MYYVFPIVCRTIITFTFAAGKNQKGHTLPYPTEVNYNNVIILGIIKTNGTDTDLTCHQSVGKSHFSVVSYKLPNIT